MRSRLPRTPRLFRGPIARAATGSLALRLSFLGSGLVQAVLLARLAGPEGYGVFAILHAVAMLAGRLAVFGLDRVALKEIATARAANDWPRINGLLRSTRHLAVRLALLCAALVFAAGMLRPGGIRHGPLLLAALGALIVVLTLLHLLQGASQGLGAIVRAQLPMNLLRSLLFVGLLAGAWATAGRLSGEAALVLNTVASAIALVLAYRMLHGQITRTEGATTPEPPGRLLSEGLPFTAHAVLFYLNAELVTLVIGAVVSAADAGLFQPVARLSNVMATGQMALAMPLAPKIAQLHSAGDKAGIEALTRRSARAALLVTAGVSIPLAVGSPFVLALFGREFTGVGASVSVLAAAQIAAAALGAPALVLSMTGHARWGLFGPLLSIVAILLLTPALIEPYGVLGGTIAMGLGLVLSRVALLVLVRRRLGILTCL